MRVNKKTLWTGWSLALGALIAGTFPASAALSPREVMVKNNQAEKLRDMKCSSQLALTHPDGQVRLRQVTMVSKLQANGKDTYSLIKFLSPADVKGTGLLTHEHAGGDDDVWLYLPALKKNRRIVSSDQSQSFVGTEFSYTDVKTPRVDDFRHSFMPKQEPGHFIIRSLPANSKVTENTGYGQKISWIRKDNFVETKVEFYDKNLKLLKTMIAENWIQADPADHKWVAKRRRMLNHQNRRASQLEISELKVNSGLDDSLFTLPYLER